jgi:hypothetical protein
MRRSTLETAVDRLSTFAVKSWALAASSLWTIKLRVLGSPLLRMLP